MKPSGAIPFLMVAVSACASAMGPIESLVERSPFLPPGYRSAPAEPREAQRPAPPVPSAASRMELVGVVAEGGVVSVSLRRRGEPRGSWLRPGESLDDVRYVRFNLPGREAVVETGGRRETIPLKPPSVSAMPAQPPPPARASAPGAAANAIPTPQPNESETPRIPVRRRVIVPSQ